MCVGIEYVRAGERVSVYFDTPGAELPVRTRGGVVQFLPWGARRETYLTDDNTPGYLLKFPIGGWASLESIRNNEWRPFEPQPVRIAASRFVQLDAMLGPCYFELERGEFIQGLLARITEYRRVYVVTVPAPAEHADKWREWPRIVRARHQ
jgi:hypothetical protein